MSAANTNRFTIAGPVGKIEILSDAPEGTPAGIAVIAHPHPLLGGNAEHKIPLQLAKIFQARGFVTVRPNFRGMDGTEGKHDGGPGEADDLVAVIRHLQHEHPGLPLALAGFSFGAFVQALVARRLLDAGEAVAHLVLSGIPWGPVAGNRSYDTPGVPGDTLVVHGEKDENVPLPSVLDWARPQELPVVVIPGANHFFTGKLPVFQRIVAAYLDTRLGTPR
jgi:alpha/beta superfamily hydrolase